MVSVVRVPCSSSSARMRCLVRLISQKSRAKEDTGHSLPRHPAPEFERLLPDPPPTREVREASHVRAVVRQRERVFVVVQVELAHLHYNVVFCQHDPEVTIRSAGETDAP